MLKIPVKELHLTTALNRNVKHTSKGIMPKNSVD